MDRILHVHAWSTQQVLDGCAHQQDDTYHLIPRWQAEVKRRAESDRQLQTHFEGELRALQERSAAQHAELHTSLKQGVDSLSTRMQDLHSIIRCAGAADSVCSQ